MSIYRCAESSLRGSERGPYLVSKVQNKISGQIISADAHIMFPLNVTHWGSPSPPLIAHPQASHTALAHARPWHCHHLVRRRGVVDIEDRFAPTQLCGSGRSVAG